MKQQDRKLRSVVKTLTYRCLIITSDSIIIYLLTHRLDITLGVIGFSNLASTILYFLHERAWGNIHWGRGDFSKSHLNLAVK